MDWAEAAAYLSQTPEWRGRLSLPPDDPRRDDDYEFWEQVEALVEGDRWRPVTHWRSPVGDAETPASNDAQR
jgi:hypothetical protein